MEGEQSYEELKKRVAILERRLKEYEQKGTEKHLQEVTKRLEKITEMGDDGMIVFLAL